ncbi:DUF21-domain-containing protein [Ascodesmis nigricans]|uniref:DUF21-domain-containing protein n=1 Tax=Ascodesmis nigricans TaxID=341454 RepID=A0A4S2MS58_9PEZI|nr:DUF21-domain-containing protein [Ascodesmis nigricans]
MPTRVRPRHGISTPGTTPTALRSLTKLALMLAAQIPALHSLPTSSSPLLSHSGDDGGNELGESPKSSEFWINVGIAFFLVVLGGIFAGLTLGLMGQDEIYLQVIEQSGEGKEKQDAAKVLRLLKRGKHWVLVTLLLSNVITNETLPIVLDRSLGGGWPAVLSSTILIVIFGEIIPQSACVRYGLGIGAMFSPFVLALMYLMYPVAYPTALLLDYILGEDHGTVYKKAGLKTLVTLHKTLGPSPSDRLNQDEVTIISAVLDLKDKPVGSIMTPISDVFTMSTDTVLDEKTMDKILSAGYSRIPIHAPGEDTNFVGMLLVKVLITYDPEDCKRVGEFPLATLPETREDTSCLDIINFFQEGKSHMVLVSETPGENSGALGVVTLEDVIEELIGEEIVDESDIYIDVHKAIRRLNPSPMLPFLNSTHRRSISTHYINRNADPSTIASTVSEIAQSAVAHDNSTNVIISHTPETQPLQSPPPAATDTPDPPAATDERGRRLSKKGLGLDEAILAHLAPANLANRPRETTSKTIKIKPHAGIPAIVTTPQAGQQVVKDYGTITSPTDGASPAPFSSLPYTDTPPPTAPAPTPGPAPQPAKARSDYLLKPRKHKKARSGSLVERVENRDGFRKTVIETTSSSESGSESEEGSRYSGRSGRSWRDRARGREREEEGRGLLEGERER